MHLFLYLLIAGCSLQSMEKTSSAEGQNIEIILSGIRNSDGHILVSLFNQTQGWPDKPDKAFRKLRIPAKAGNMKLSLDALPPGKYAFAIIHDENDNLELDTGLFGVPKEGFCFSNDAMGTFGPPSFEDSCFSSPSQLNHNIKIRYW